jgi:hypothetical protein
MYRVGLSSCEVLIVVAPFEISAFGQQQRIGSVMISSCERHPHETAYGAFPLDVDITIEVGFEEPDVAEQYCSAFGRHGVEDNGDVRLALKHLPHGAICENNAQIGACPSSNPLEDLPQAPVHRARA